MPVARHPAGIPAGGRFAPHTHAEVELELAASSSQAYGMDRFRSARPPEAVMVANNLLGAEPSMRYGEAWQWWQANGTWETIEPGGELWTDQKGLRGDHIVDQIRAEIRTQGAEAVFEPAPDVDQVDADFDVSGWPKLVRLDGKVWVLDGHHRLTAAAAEGVPATVLVADLDAYRAKVAESDPWPMPEGDGFADHICEHHWENESFSWDLTIVEDPDESDGIEFVTVDELESWHDWAHQLGLSDHHHGPPAR